MTNKHKQKIHQKSSTYLDAVKEYESKFDNDKSDPIPRYRGLDDELQKIDAETRKKLEEKYRNKTKIRSKADFDDYIYDLINPFQSMEAIIDKLSRKIDDQKNDKTKSKYWQQINEETRKLNQEFGEKKFKYLLNPPSRTKYDITFHSDSKTQESEYIPFQELSSGERMIFELICYYFVVCKDNTSKNTVKQIILDEFDANLNPSLAELYLKTVKKEFIENGIKVILTTHSPSTVAEVEPENLCELINDEEGHKIEWAENEDGKKKILEKLAPKFVYDDELGPLGAIKGSKDVIVFVEGKSDEIFFTKEATKRGLNNYKFIECSSASKMQFALKAFSSIPYFKKILESKIIIGLVDFDAEGIRSIELTFSTDPENIKRKIQNFQNIKEPIFFKEQGVHLLALIPPKDHEAWTSYRNDNSRYRLEELRDEATDDAIERQFAKIASIVSESRLSNTNN